MSDTVKIRYRYESIEQWEAVQEQLRELIKQDTGEEFWIETKSLPPFGMPPPVTKDCVEKLRQLDGVVVDEVDED
ncbi:hypothetical protein ACHAP5_006043 [Fusarium lateritium]